MLKDLVDLPSCEQEVKKDVLKHHEGRRGSEARNQHITINKHVVPKVRMEDYHLLGQAYH